MTREAVPRHHHFGRGCCIFTLAAILGWLIGATGAVWLLLDAFVR